MATAIFYDLENISKFTAPKNYNEFKASLLKISESELVDGIILQRAYISTTHPAYIKYNKFLKSTGIDICGVDPNTNSGKANLVDFKMNVDCIAYSLSNNIDTVVVATGDADFGFLCEELKSCGKRVVVASYGITTNKSIIMLSDDWVDFSGEYKLVGLSELFASRIRLQKTDDYQSAVRMVLTAMLDDKLIKRYMALERFTLDMLRTFTENICPAPVFSSMDYYDFVSLLIDGINISLKHDGDNIFIIPCDTPLEAPPLNLYETISGLDFNFSAKRFKAWHEWFEENAESLPELMYYLEFMTRNNLIRTNGDSTEIVPKRKCSSALMEHTANAVSLLNISPDKDKLEQLKQRFHREPARRSAAVVIEEPVIEPEEPLQTTYVQGIITNFGRIVVFADDEAVTRIDVTEEFVKYKINSVTLRAVQEIREFFKGERSKFDVPVKMEGSDFQKAVWQALREIPYGETRTYSDIAKAIGKPRSSRAVGSACNKNKLPFIIPCHRVVAASGDNGGFAFGPELKKALLAAEASPIDFRRFGKLYLQNISHPESMNEYISSAELSKIDVERREAEKVDIPDANKVGTSESVQDNSAETTASPDREAIPEAESMEDKPKKASRKKSAKAVNETGATDNTENATVEEKPKKTSRKKSVKATNETGATDNTGNATVEEKPKKTSRKKSVKAVNETGATDNTGNAKVEEKPKKTSVKKSVKAVNETGAADNTGNAKVEENADISNTDSEKTTAPDEAKNNKRKPYRRKTQRNGSIAKKSYSAKKNESKEN